MDFYKTELELDTLAIDIESGLDKIKASSYAIYNTL